MKRVLTVALIFITLTCAFVSCMEPDRGGNALTESTIGTTAGTTAGTTVGFMPDTADKTTAITTSIDVTQKAIDSVKIEDIVKAHLKNVENSEVFYKTICDVVNKSGMGISYDFFDLDGNGDNELIVSYAGAMIMDCSVYDNVGDKVELLADLDGSIYINNKGDIRTHYKISSENINYYQYKDGVWKYQNYSIGSTGGINPIYYIITDRDSDFRFISNYYEGKYNMQYKLYKSVNDTDTYIQISDYETDKACYELALSELTKDFVEIEKFKYLILKVDDHVTYSTSSN